MVKASIPVGSEMDDVLAVSSVELMACPFVTGPDRTSLVNPVSDPRSVGEYVLVGISSMATSPLEIMVCPVVPAGMLAFATTADVVTGATTVEPEPAFLLAPSTLAYAMALPATNSSTPIMTSMSVCLFTEPSPSQPTATVRSITRCRRRWLRWRVRREGVEVHRSF